MLFNTPLRNNLILLALGGLLPLLTAVTVYHTNRAPVRYDGVLAGAHIRFEAARGAIWWRGGCTAVAWDVEGVATVAVDGSGVVGVGEADRVCVWPRYMPRLTFTVPGSAVLHTVDLPVTLVGEARPVQAALWAGLALWGAAALSTPRPRQWWQALPRAERVHLMLLVAVVTFGAVYRMAYLGRPVMLDEANTLYTYGTMPSAYQVMASYIDPNNHILHSLLVREAARFGHAPWIFRLPAFVAGVLIIPLTYAVGRALYNRDAGLVAAALTAGSFRLADYTTDARGYTLLTLFTLALLWLAVRARLADAPRWYWAAYAVLSALGFYTIPVMYYGLGVVSLWLLISIWVENTGRDRWRRLAGFAAATLGGAGLTLLLYSPIILNTPEALFGNFMVNPSPLPPGAFLGEVGEIAWGFINDGTPPVLVWLLLTSALAATALHRRLSPTALPLLPVAAVWLLGVILTQYIVPLERLWLWAVPVYMTTAAAGIVWAVRQITRREWLAGVIGVGFMLALAYSAVTGGAWERVTAGRHIPGAEQAVLYLADHPTSTQRVIMTHSPADYPLRFYTDYHRPANPPELTYYLYPEELAAMRADTRHGYTFAPSALWNDAAGFATARGIDIAPGEIVLELAVEVGGWRLYRVRPAG